MSRRRSTGVTIRAIAAEAGVSIATVSRVLNGHVYVADETRRIVQRAVERLGAKPSAPSRSVQGAVYVRCPYVLTDYFGTIVSSVAETLDLHGRRLILSAGDAALRVDALPGLPDDPEIAGAVLILPPESGEQLRALQARNFPFVVVDPRVSSEDIASVSASHFAGARSLTAHLIELGHRRIGVIGGPQEWLASDSRIVGHAAALATAGLLPSPELLVRNVEPVTDWGYDSALRLLDLPDPPTAIVAFNDKSAVGALRAAHERGLRVPEDLSITGFDDVYLSLSTLPMLTTVRQPLEEMGRMAVTLLMRLLDGHTIESLHVELATHLIVRDSTGPAPNRT
ncbi:transcriptional regulator [Acrocarpospora phusangensis]|uniref:Transcriptional regulator n=1 Tax=Acrocarpospora phusangensis TaxID=1070424 RepID=A0A919UQT3_9ACTN|nr:substrate-binding domain-containing protein [Acrocarpospora phusangensis]GIH24875.1 transcriptional regulator [Acrocarpospora phusangensis]